MVILFAAISVVCAVGWMFNRLMVLALLMYILGKGWPEPTKEEWTACIREVIQNLLSDWFS